MLTDDEIRAVRGQTTLFDHDGFAAYDIPLGEQLSPEAVLLRHRGHGFEMTEFGLEIFNQASELFNWFLAQAQRELAQAFFCADVADYLRARQTEGEAILARLPQPVPLQRQQKRTGQKPRLRKQRFQRCDGFVPVVYTESTEYVKGCATPSLYNPKPKRCTIEAVAIPYAIMQLSTADILFSDEEATSLADLISSHRPTQSVALQSMDDISIAQHEFREGFFRDLYKGRLQHAEGSRRYIRSFRQLRLPWERVL